jgi:hypothetical protein
MWRHRHQRGTREELVPARAPLSQYASRRLHAVLQACTGSAVVAHLTEHVRLRLQHTVECRPEARRAAWTLRSRRRDAAAILPLRCAQPTAPMRLRTAARPASGTLARKSPTPALAATRARFSATTPGRSRPTRRPLLQSVRLCRGLCLGQRPRGPRLPSPTSALSAFFGMHRASCQLDMRQQAIASSIRTPEHICGVTVMLPAK